MRVLEKIKFLKERKYPIAFATILFYLAWHPLGDFIESLIIGWNIVPCELFTHRFFAWWIPFFQHYTHNYTIAFLGYFVQITVFAYLVYFIFKKYQRFEFNKYLKILFLLIVIVFWILPFFVGQFTPQKSIAYQNDIEGFQRNDMEPLNIWMYFHMAFWFIWMIFPHLLGLFTNEKQMLKIAGVTWLVFLLVWLLSWHFGSFFHVQVVFPGSCL